jgi:hypothetical protein
MSLAPNDLFTHLLPQWQFEERHHRLLRVSPAAALAAAAAYRPNAPPHAGADRRPGPHGLNFFRCRANPLPLPPPLVHQARHVGVP